MRPLTNRHLAWVISFGIIVGGGVGGGVKASTSSRFRLTFFTLKLERVHNVEKNRSDGVLGERKRFYRRTAVRQRPVNRDKSFRTGNAAIPGTNRERTPAAIIRGQPARAVTVDNCFDSTLSRPRPRPRPATAKHRPRVHCPAGRSRSTNDYRSPVTRRTSTRPVSGKSRRTVSTANRVNPKPYLT